MRGHELRHTLLWYIGHVAGQAAMHAAARWLRLDDWRGVIVLPSSGVAVELPGRVDSFIFSWRCNRNVRSDVGTAVLVAEA